MKKLYIALLVLVGVFMVCPSNTSGNTPVTLNFNIQSNDSITVFARWIPRDDGGGQLDGYEVEWKLNSMVIKVRTVIGTADSLRIQRPINELSNISVSVRAIRRGFASIQKTNTMQIPAMTPPPSGTIPVDTLPPGTDLGIYRMRIAQANYGSNILVEDRAALLRIWISGQSTRRPNITVRLNETDTLVLTKPTSFDTTYAGSLSSTYHVLVPGNVIKPNLQISAILRVLDDSSTNNVAITTPDVRKTNTLTLAVLPVTIQGLTSVVTSTMQTEIVQWTTRIFPLENLDVRVITTPMLSNAPTLQSNDSNGGWLTVLSEVNSWRVSNGRASEYVAAIVPVTYGSGVAGYAFRPGRASVTWDKNPFGRIYAHELGHNLSLGHAPGCGATNTDANFPRSTGSIGFPGWSSTLGVTAASILSPTTSDLMNYCGTQHISEYNWEKVLTHRAAISTIASIASVVEQAERDSIVMITGTVINDSVSITTKELYGYPDEDTDVGEVTIQTDNKTLRTRKLYIDDAPQGEVYQFVMAIRKNAVGQSISINFRHKNSQITKVISIN
jgi:hypothetical protein